MAATQQTQDLIGLKVDSKPKYDEFDKPSEGDYKKAAFLSPGSPVSGVATRPTSKSATGAGWTADTPVNASKVKSSGVAPID